jgi:hypothetical protein
MARAPALQAGGRWFESNIAQIDAVFSYLEVSATFFVPSKVNDSSLKKLPGIRFSFSKF